MSVDYNDIFGNVKETYNSLGTFQFTPDIDNYETPQEFEHLGPIPLSDGEENVEKNKKKPKSKRIQKKKLPNIDNNYNYEPDDTINISNRSTNRKTIKRLNKSKESDNDCSVIDISTPPRVSRGRGRSNVRQRGRGRGSRKGRSTANNSIITYNIGNTTEYPDDLENVPMFNTQCDDDDNYEPDDTINISNRSTNRRTSKRLKKSKKSDNDCSVIDISTPPTVSRGRGRSNVRQGGRGRGSRRGRSTANNSIITYNIGNTMEYPDDLENVPMFNTQCDDVTALDNSVDVENQEMSVKIEWQSVELFKFTIRKFQNLKQIFDFFCTKYNVEKGNLLFMYDNKILQPDDTPDTIGYRESKLIDGGIIYKNKMKISKNSENVEKVKSGIQIKFQYKNSKHPFIIYVQNNDKLSLAMTKCAEKLEVPMNKLKFEFDGDIVSGKQTPNDLDLEGGECIDVKIIK